MPRVRSHWVKGHKKRIRRYGNDKLVRVKGHKVKAHMRRKAR